jgi:alkaline phosphatase
MKKTLVILAAGIGNRYGGAKQITPVGPCGERIIDFSMYDAYKAGFEKIDAAAKISDATSDKIMGNYLIKANAPSMSSGEETGYVAFDRVLKEALEYLSQDEDGFFLMAEGAHIDHGGHNNDMTYMLQELLAFDDGVRVVLEWAKDRDDTVVIVTADHETGGLKLKNGITGDNMFDMGSLDDGMTYAPLYYEWTSASHTQQDVYCFINGANIDFADYSFGEYGKIKNEDVFQIMKSLLEG